MKLIKRIGSLLNKGKYGYSIKKPILLSDVLYNKLYLNNLVDSNGNGILWKRYGSLRHKKFEMPIDKYSISNLEGAFICDLYIYSYHHSNLEKAPDGFSYSIS